MALTHEQKMRCSVGYREDHYKARIAELEAALRRRIRSLENVDRLWDALRKVACVTEPPTDAKCIVQLRREDVVTIARRAAGQHRRRLTDGLVHPDRVPAWRVLWQRPHSHRVGLGPHGRGQQGAGGGLCRPGRAAATINNHQLGGPQMMLADELRAMATSEAPSDRAWVGIARRAADVLNSNDKRVAALEAAIRAMHAAIPGGDTCDPQQVADDLREIAAKAGVTI